jgi:hypothetical protein
MLKKMIIICACFALSLLAVPVPTFSQTAGYDGYIGVITKSDNKKMVGTHISFANIRTIHPFITFPSGNGAETDKVYEDDEIVVLLFVAMATGSTETYHINKKSKRFTRVEVGALEAVVSGKDFQPIVSYGTLK